MTAHIGDRLRDRYEMEEFLGRGGMSDVYLAFDTRRQVRVAVKVLREDLAEDVEFVRRFRREAEALAQLDHPNIVRFYSFERQGTTAFIVMDYVSGATLRRRLAEVEGPLSVEEATAILRPVVAALQYAHNEGYVHRDIKPGNIMLRDDGTVLLSDFGIARATESITMTTGPIGTPAYMSPEQILGQSVDQRTDVYSLGVVLYEMLAGRRPFTGETGIGVTTIERVRHEHLHAEPVDLRRLESSNHPGGGTDHRQEHGERATSALDAGQGPPDSMGESDGSGGDIDGGAAEVGRNLDSGPFHSSRSRGARAFLGEIGAKVGHFVSRCI